MRKLSVSTFFRNYAYVPLLVPSLIVACGKKESEDKDKPVTAVATAKPTATAATPLASSPKAAVTLLETASKSAGSSISSMSSAGSALLLSEGVAIPGCSTGGEPISQDAAKNTSHDEHDTAVLPDSDPEYALGKFYCTIAQNSGDEGSILGAFDLPKMITCLVGDQITFDGTEHTFDVVTASSACFSSGGPDGLPATLTVKVTADKPALGAGTGWDSSYDMAIYGGQEKVAGIKMLMKSTATQVAVAFQGGGTETDAFSFNLDTAAGLLRYEGKFLRIPEQGWSDHTRILIKGAINTDGSFTSLTGLEGARSSIYSNQGSSAIKSGNLLTIKGEESLGYKTYAYKCGGTCDGQDLALFAPVTGTGTCDAGPQSPTCTGNSGLQLDAVSGLAFLMRPAETGFQSGATWISTLSPLTFTSVTLAQSQE